MLERFGIDQVVEQVILSSELGATKPDPEFWVRAKRFCQELGVVTDDAQILVIDDDARNCQSAQDLGMQAIQYAQFDDSFITNVRRVVTVQHSDRPARYQPNHHSSGQPSHVRNFRL